MSLKPIIMDIEASGLDLVRCGIWQIGAVDLNTMEEFFEESRIDDEDEIVNVPDADKTVLEVIGKTEEELRDSNKQSQKQMLENFFYWVEQKPFRNFLCQNPQFDVAILQIKSRKYGIKIPFHYRSFDLHSTAQKTYHDLHNQFLIEEDHSSMGLTNILKLCGMEDNRQVHNALEDAKLTAECFSRLMYGKNLLEEYNKFPVPEVLRK